jgi:ABC-type siderophore export system fused ATPase/permease subunit
MHNAASISTNLDHEDQLVPEGKDLVQGEKNLKIYKRREKMIPKVVRQSVRPCEKTKNSN